jgi:hypothetical protein
MSVTWGVVFERSNAVQILTISPWDTNTCMAYTSVALITWYLTVRQRMLGTITIQTVRILYTMIVQTHGQWSPSNWHFRMANSNYFQYTKPGSSTVRLSAEEKEK